MNKIAQTIITVLTLACSALSLHAEKIVAGPRGGRLVATEPHQAEFFVNKDRKAEVTFYDASLKPAAIQEQVVALIAETPGGRSTIALQKTSTGFISVDALPAGESYRIVMQVREKPNTKPQNFRINFNMAECGECKHAEYACTCDDH